MLCVMEQTPSFRHQIPPAHYDAWREMLSRTGLTQGDAVNRLIGFLLEQDQVTQAMVLGTVTPAPDLIARALNRKAHSDAPVIAAVVTSGAATPPSLRAPKQSPQASRKGTPK